MEIKKHILKLMFALVLCLGIFSEASAKNTDSSIIIFIDAPMQQVTGGGTVVGWAIAPNGVDRMELFVDGEYYSDIPMGSLRVDVGIEYPSYPNSDTSGFSLYYPYFLLSEGIHTFDLYAFDAMGNYNIATTTIDTSVFEGVWSPASEVDLSNIEVSKSTGFITIDKLIIKDKSHSVTMEWDYVLQGLAIKEIVSGTPVSYLVGTWKGRFKPSAPSCTGEDAKIKFVIRQEGGDDPEVFLVSLASYSGALFIAVKTEESEEEDNKLLVLEPDNGSLYGEADGRYFFDGALLPDGTGKGYSSPTGGDCGGTWSVIKE